MNTATQILPSAPPVAPLRHRHPTAMQWCPRPHCGGRLMRVDVDLEEAVMVCMLCAREVRSSGQGAREAS